MTTEVVAQVAIEKDLAEEVQVAEITGVVADNATTGVVVVVIAAITEPVEEVVTIETRATGISKKDIDFSSIPIICLWADSPISIEILDLRH